MIKKISKMKNFGIFYDFFWNDELPEFKQFNLIYGWNRSGKTTVSRIFESCEKQCTYNVNKFKQYPENGEFEIETNSGIKVQSNGVYNSNLLIKVFNRDFIDDNISFDPSNPCRPIIYISEKEILSKEKLKELYVEKENLEKKWKESTNAKSVKEESNKFFLTGLGREIANILFNKSYNKTNVEDTISRIGIDCFSDKILKDEDKRTYEVTSKSGAGDALDPFPEYQFSFTFEGKTIDSFIKIFEMVGELLRKKIVSVILDRLKEDKELNNWVKRGFDLYKIKNEKEKCLFCEKPLDIDFLKKLSKHFSKDYEDLLSAIIIFKNEILKIKKDELPLKNDDLNPGLRKNYKIKVEELNKIIRNMNLWIDGVIARLDEKYSNPLTVFENMEKPKDFLALYNSIIVELNDFIFKHNEKIQNHSDEVSNAKDKLELNSIAIALKDQNYKQMLSEIDFLIKKESKAKEKFDNCNREIEKLENITSDITLAIPKINKHIMNFFGRGEIQLELDENKKGYNIKRNEQYAKTLSEGEKTAIAFSYFIIKVEESDFDKSNGIIFIDDPISSLDSNFIYHCFSLLNTNFGEVGQLFISTHNFQLFNLVKGWFLTKNNKANKDNNKAINEGSPIKQIPCDFFMIENYTESTCRKARIVKLDKTLRKYKSEYHFLFAKLSEFLNKQDSKFEDLYTIGNMARRFFDIFADFKVPTTDDQKSKLDVLIKAINNPYEKISNIITNKAYKLMNEFSHNSDPIGAIEHIDKSECEEIIAILLRIVKESDPMHYEILERNC